ncbi:MAG: hypothetical protein ABUT20_66365, partial [Bacteroidota bacterium]
MKLKLCIGFGLLLMVFASMAQQQSKLDLALRFIENQHSAWALSKDDISDLAVSDMYESENNGVTHMYLIQRYDGIEIHTAIT